MRKTSSPIKIRSGQIEFQKVNADTRDLRDMYHWLLTLTWSQFSLFILAIDLAINLTFSIFY
jgi:hypothetical protein